MEGGAAGERATACRRWCERTAIEAADAVIAVSAGMRADILGTYPAVDPDRVVVIPNGIDPDEYRPTPAPTPSSGSASTPTGRRWSSSAG